MRKIKTEGWSRAALAAGILLAAPLAAQQAEPQPLSLSQAVSMAARTTAGVSAAELRVTEAEARVAQARSELLPTVSASSSLGERTFNLEAMGVSFPTPAGSPPIDPRVGPVTGVDARLHLNQALFDAAGVARTRAAREAVGTATAERATVSQTAAQRAALAYLRAARAGATLAARQADAALAAELLDLAQQQLRAGVSTAIDVTRARTQKVAADGQVLVARNAAERARIELARAMGADPGTRFTLTDSLGARGFGGSVPTDEEAAVAQALQRRPELAQAAAAGTAAEAARRAIQAERLPRLDMVADYGANGLHVGDAVSTGSVGVQLSLPIMDGFRREARLKEQEAVVREATLRTADLRQQVQAEVQGALLDLQNGREQGDVAAERLRLAEDELALARERFSNGVAGNLELIQAQASLLAARDAVIEARFTTASAQANLARAVGAAETLR
jgi:outer membrane protein